MQPQQTPVTPQPQISPLPGSPAPVSSNPPMEDILNRIAQVNNILVTVKANPSVDELAAALGLTIALNAVGKHATAVFSGTIPNAMSFLNPEKVFENNVHSLRDFIISLNKDKADKLRFAKDGEIVKIYITPYKSTITPKDLAYDEGDFNVEMVLAIGIVDQQNIDAVIAAHGRILHDATVATINSGPTAGQIGSINWSDATVNSSSAMIVQLLEGMNLSLTPEISTALLTGLVASTDRFSNQNTTPAIMELAARLMASGADHQLVTSSVGNTPSGIRPAPVPQARKVDTTKQELTLDVHSQSVQAPASTPKATNQTPIAQTPPEVAQPTVEPTLPPAPLPPASQNPLPTPTPVLTAPAPLPPPTPAPAEQPAIPTPTPQPEPLAPVSPQSNEASAKLEEPLASQPAYSTPVESTPAPQTPLPSPDVEKNIRSEIDDIYSAEPFNPANQPRSDLGLNIAVPSQSLEAVDTSVQHDQALGSKQKLAEIPATKDSAVGAEQLIGSSKDVIPGLEMPPTLPPPPPPPPIDAPANPFASPVASPVNFDPTKPNQEVTQENPTLIKGTENLAANQSSSTISATQL